MTFPFILSYHFSHLVKASCVEVLFSVFTPNVSFWPIFLGVSRQFIEVWFCCIKTGSFLGSVVLPFLLVAWGIAQSETEIQTWMKSSPTDTKYQPTHFGLLDSELLQLLQLEERAIFKDKRASCQCDLQISAKVLFTPIFFLTSFFLQAVYNNQWRKDQ